MLFSNKNFNLLQFPFFRTLIKWTAFPYVIQSAILFVFVCLIYIGWGQYADQGVDPKLYRKTNLTTLMIWGVWWPLMIWGAVLLGRVWCGICPLELIANLSERVARRFNLRTAHLPKWMAIGFLSVILYFLIQFLVAGISLHRVPAYTSIFLLVLLVSSIVVSLFWKDRAFCRGFCPVGVLLSAYGRGGMLAVRKRKNASCDSCKDQNCINPKLRYKQDARSCPSLLNPTRLNDNHDCLLCLQCVKSCPTQDMELILRSPFSKQDSRNLKANWPITLFTMIVSGFVIYELCSEWETAKNVFLALPLWAANILSMEAYFGWIKGVWMLIAVPLFLWSFIGFMVCAMGGASSILDAIRRIAYPMLPIIAVGHMAKAFAKLSTWPNYLPLALTDPFGHETAVAISQQQLIPPERLYSITVAGSVGLLLLGLGIVMSIRETKLIDSFIFKKYTAPLLGIGVFFLFLVSGWIWG